MKLAVLCVLDRQGRTGGAERLFRGLHAALREHGHDAQLVPIESDESTFEAIEETYLRCYDFDATSFDGVISTKAPTYLVRHPNHICYLVHTIRVFYDMFEQTFPHPTRELEAQRVRIQRLDTLALSPPRTRRVFAIGHEVATRLQRTNRITASVLHPPLGFDAFRSGPYGEYVFLPGRLHRWKRIDLAIEAMHFVRSRVRLLIAGSGEEDASLRALAHSLPNVELLGQVADAELVELYANALAVAFAPLREDYGYVTLEAFRSNKPVVTCVDSGEPAVLVEHERSGLVVEPKPQALAAAFDRLYENRELTASMGRAGARKVREIRWDRVASVLSDTLGAPTQMAPCPADGRQP